MKSVNDYVKSAPTPEWFEYTIFHLPKHDILNFIADLTRAIRERKWDSLKVVAILTDRANNWLDLQHPDTLKELLQWVAMELI
jgi:hypothetical protein